MVNFKIENSHYCLLHNIRLFYKLYLSIKISCDVLNICLFLVICENKQKNILGITRTLVMGVCIPEVNSCLLCENEFISHLQSTPIDLSDVAN